MMKNKLVMPFRYGCIGIGIIITPISAYALDYDVQSSGNWTADSTWSPEIAGGPGASDSIVSSIADHRSVQLDGPANTAYTIASLSNSGSGTLSFSSLLGSGSKTLNITGDVLQNGSGTLSFEAAGYQQFVLNIGGNMTVQQGTLRLGTVQSLGATQILGLTDVYSGAELKIGTDSRPEFLGGVNLREGATLEIYRPRLGGSFPRVDFGGLSGSGVIRVIANDGNRVNNMRLVSGSGDYTFSGEVTTTVDAGSLVTEILRSGAAGAQILRGQIGSHTGTTTINGGVLAFAGDANLTTGNINLQHTVSGIGSILGVGSSDLSRDLGTGEGQIRLSGTSAGFAAYDEDRLVTLGASGLTWGSTHFSMGNLVLGHSSADSTVEITNAIDLNGSPRTVQMGNGSAAIDGRLSGVISGSGASALIVSGDGALELTGSNTYAGGTTVTGGATLLVNNTNGSATGTGDVVIEQEATLAGSGSIAGQTSVSGTLAPGSNGIGSLSVGDLRVSETGSLSFEFGMHSGSPTSDKIIVAGDVTLESGANLGLTQISSLSGVNVGDIFFLILNNGVEEIAGTFTLLNNDPADLSQGSRFTLNGYEWSLSYQADYAAGTMLGGNDLAIELIAIPEFSSYALIIALGGALLVIRRKRR